MHHSQEKRPTKGPFLASVSESSDSSALGTYLPAPARFSVWGFPTHSESAESVVGGATTDGADPGAEGVFGIVP